MKQYLEAFEHMAKVLSPYIDRCIFSFVEMYKKLESNMPELIHLSEQDMDALAQGLVIDKVTVKRPEVVSYPVADEFCRLLTEQAISHMTRRGKF